ncbi:MAG TPA: glycosyltransferase, partial [Xanthomonadaceae bacterium]|nr:glycosyltransferase [Xanthomonadaceae bacterium]
ALASGLPTVAFDYGATREVLRDGQAGAAVVDGDDARFVEAFTRLGRDDRLRGAMRGAATAAVAHLRPAQVAADFDAILQQVQVQQLAADALNPASARVAT